MRKHTETADERFTRILFYGFSRREKLRIRRRQTKLVKNWLKKHQHYFPSKCEAIDYYYYCQYQD